MDTLFPMHAVYLLANSFLLKPSICDSLVPPPLPPGRIKDVIITSGGKNIAPYPIEEKIKAELGDFVSNCVVVGDKQKHLACLLTVRAVLDPVTAEATSQMDAAAWEWCNSHGARPESVPDLVLNRHKYEAVWDAVMEALETVNKVNN